MGMQCFFIKNEMKMKCEELETNDSSESNHLTPAKKMLLLE